MQTVNVAASRIAKDRAVGRSECPLLQFVIAWSEQLRSPTISGKRVQMLPAVFLRGDHQLIVRNPVDYAAARVARHGWIRTLRRRAAVPDFAGLRRDRVRHPDCPRMRFVRRNEIAFRSIALFRWTPHKRDALSVQRPDGLTI